MKTFGLPIRVGQLTPSNHLLCGAREGGHVTLDHKSVTKRSKFQQIDTLMASTWHTFLTLSHSYSHTLTPSLSHTHTLTPSLGHIIHRNEVSIGTVQFAVDAVCEYSYHQAVKLCVVDVSYVLVGSTHNMNHHSSTQQYIHNIHRKLGAKVHVSFMQAVSVTIIDQWVSVGTHTHTLFGNFFAVVRLKQENLAFCKIT